MGARSPGNFRLHIFQVTAQTRSRAGSAFLETPGFRLPRDPADVDTRGRGGTSQRDLRPVDRAPPRATFRDRRRRPQRSTTHRPMTEAFDPQRHARRRMTSGHHPTLPTYHCRAPPKHRRRAGERAHGATVEARHTPGRTPEKIFIYTHRPRRRCYFSSRLVRASASTPSGTATRCCRTCGGRARLARPILPPHTGTAPRARA